MTDPAAVMRRESVFLMPHGDRQHFGVMPIRHIEHKVECVRGLLGNRNRDEMGSAFPKHFGGEGCWVRRMPSGATLKPGRTYCRQTSPMRLSTTVKEASLGGQGNSQHNVFKS